MKRTDPREPTPRLLPLAVLLPWLLMLLFWALVFPAQAGERRARLSIELELEGRSRWGDARDGGQAQLKRRYRLVTELRADGEGMSVDTKAPDYAEKMMARAALVQLRALSPPRGAVTPVRSAAVEAEYADEGRFLNYSGIDARGASVEVQAEERSEGRYADVQGPVPWSETRSVAGGLSADELRLLCLSLSLVLDTRTQTLRSDAGFVLPEPPALTQRSERGRTERSTGRLSTLAPVARWVAERTRQAPRRGSAEADLPLSAADLRQPGSAAGTVHARLRWSFEDL